MACTVVPVALVIQVFVVLVQPILVNINKQSPFGKNRQEGDPKSVSYKGEAGRTCTTAVTNCSLKMGGLIETGTGLDCFSEKRGTVEFSALCMSLNKSSFL